MIASDGTCMRENNAPQQIAAFTSLPAQLARLEHMRVCVCDCVAASRQGQAPMLMMFDGVSNTQHAACFTALKSFHNAPAAAMHDEALNS